MRLNELTQKSKLCTGCDGSGKTPVCEKCHGYGAMIEGIDYNLLTIKNVLEEGMSMSDLHYIVNNIRSMKQVKCEVNLSNFTIKLEFNLDNVYGAIWLKPRKDGTDLGKKFVKKIKAAACSRMGGSTPIEKIDVDIAKKVLDGFIGNQSIKILTNSMEWEVVGLRYGSFNFGEGLN